MPYTLSVSYTTVGLINSGFPAITSVTALTSGIVAGYAGMVEAEINAKIAKQYQLPLTLECPILTAIATREAIFRIAVQRQLVQFPPAQQGRSPLQVQHSDDQKLLQQISDGEVTLYGVNSNGAFNSLIPANTSDIQIFSTTMNYNPTFHEGSVFDAVIDTDKLDDIDDDRDGRGL